MNAENVTGHGFELNFEFLASAALFIDVGFNFNVTFIDDLDLSGNGCGSATVLYGCTVKTRVYPMARIRFMVTRFTTRPS